MKNALSSRLADEYLVPAILAGLTLIVHLIGNPHYGFFRDELYFIICGRHPDWGYVDQPPLVPLLAAASQAFGISLFLLRMIPALFAAGGVFVTTRLVREFGGGAFAQTIAGLCVALAPVFLAFGTQLGPDDVGLWLWPLAALYVARLAQGADPRWWLGVGIALGVSGEAKYSVLFFGVALLVGIAISPSRRILLTPWMPAGVALALLIVAPNVAWQVSHGLPMLELLRNGQHGKNVVLSPLEFVLADVVILNPLLSLVWLGGLILAFVRTATRWIGWTFAIVIATMIALHAKDYYPADAYPLLFATGGIALELVTRRVTFLRSVFAAIALAAGAVLLPFGTPVLGETQYVSYAHAIGRVLHAPAEEHHKPARLGQDFADMHGWPEMTAAVARVYDGLASNERATAGINASNYGEASAINFFGATYDLPVASSGHNQYWLWGPHFVQGGVLIDVNGDLDTLHKVCASVTLAATFSNPWGMPYEDDLPIYVCRGFAPNVASIWPLVRNYN
jgi:MFS family permease